MNTTVNELKAYYVKNGGQASDVVGIDTIPDMIAKITEISGGGGGGGGLPEVTDADDGKVLIVDNGQWTTNNSRGVTVIESIITETGVNLGYSYNDIIKMGIAILYYEDEEVQGLYHTCFLSFHGRQNGNYICIFDSIYGDYQLVFGSSDPDENMVLDS